MSEEPPGANSAANFQKGFAKVPSDEYPGWNAEVGTPGFSPHYGDTVFDPSAQQANAIGTAVTEPLAPRPEGAESTVRLPEKPPPTQKELKEFPGADEYDLYLSSPLPDQEWGIVIGDKFLRYSKTAEGVRKSTVQALKVSPEGEVFALLATEGPEATAMIVPAWVLHKQKTILKEKRSSHIGDSKLTKPAEKPIKRLTPEQALMLPQLTELGVDAVRQGTGERIVKQGTRLWRTSDGNEQIFEVVSFRRDPKNNIHVIMQNPKKTDDQVVWPLGFAEIMARKRPLSAVPDQLGAEQARHIVEPLIGQG